MKSLWFWRFLGLSRLLDPSCGRALKVSILCGVFAACVLAQPQIISSYRNDATTGTIKAGLVSVSAPGRVIATPAAATDGVIGICHENCGLDGAVQIVATGVEPLSIDNATTAGDWIQIGSAGYQGHDTGSKTRPISGQVIGQAVTTNAGAGTYLVQLQLSGSGGSGSGSGTVTSVTIAGTANEITATGTCTGTVSVTCTLSIPPGFVLPGTIDGLTITTTTGTFTLTNGKTFAVGNSVTITGTDATTYNFPAPSSVTNGDCAGLSKSGSTIGITDAGACGAGTGNAASTVAVSFSATPTYTCLSSTAGTVTDFLVAQLTGNITSSTLASCTSGQEINFVFQQPASGGPYTAAMPTGFDPAPLSQTASIYTTLTYLWDGTHGRLLNSTNDTQTLITMSERAAVGTPASSSALCWPDSTDHAGIECKANASSSVFKLTLAGADINPVTGIVSSINGKTITLSGNFTTTGAFNPTFAIPSSSTWTYQSGGGTLTQTICSGTLALGTSAIASGAAATTVTATCTGLAATDNISLDFNASPLAVTGYIPSANGMLTILKWPTSNTINVSVVNNTASSVTPGSALTLNYRVTR